MPRMPGLFIAALAGLAGLAGVLLLTWFGVPPFDNVFIFIVSNVVSFFAILALACLGGAFLGMLLTHRIFSNREFSPFERTMIETLNEVREATRRLETTERELTERLANLEKELLRR